MNQFNPLNSQGSSQSATPSPVTASAWQRLKGARLSYLTLPLLVMATIVEFVILATGWKYQQMVCLPQGMGVTFFGIGPIGATILAVELLKLPLAIWTASRHGWQKTFMLFVGLPLICVLTFQLVKDMAVYEMSTAMQPAGQFLEQAAAEEVKIKQLNGELAAIEGKKTERERKLAELTAKEAKAKADFEASVKRNDEVRQDAISLTDYQKKELSEVESRQATIIKQFDADAAQLTKLIADLRAQREVELGRATKWNAEEARIENDYKTKLAAYTNKKTTYEKDKAEYENAGILKRQLLKEPIHPGVPPEREANTILKPTAIAEIDAQIKSKEDELTAVHNKRRDRVAQVEVDARRLRAEFDQRSSAKREQTDTKRDELAAAHAALLASLKAEEKQVDADVAAAVKNVDGIRAEIDASRKKADGFYEAREQAIRNTQVHRIATTVEIVRGLIFGERPMSITATAKERGDVLTDQISMVRIWVYPVLAFIVAFLPTLMVEIGFSTLFKPEQQKPAHRLGFLGRRLHWLYIRAGRQKVLRAERLAGEASTAIALREKSLAEVKAAADKALFEKDAELLSVREALNAAGAKHADELQRKEQEWVGKVAATTDSLNKAIIEKDALRDLQRSEVDRQVQMRQHAWSERITQMRQELDDQRTAAETERTTLMQEHQQKLLEVTEDCKTQVIQARRQLADAELAAVEKSAKLAHDLKEALHARDAAEAELKHQADLLSRQLMQARDDAAREQEKAIRQEKHRSERQQLDFDKTVRQREEEFARRLQQREQELTLAFEARVAEEKVKAEQDARRREAELERQFEVRALEAESRWGQDTHQREEALQTKLKQREQQLQAQADGRLADVQAQAEQELRRRETEFERQLTLQVRETETRLREEAQQKELAFLARLKQREQELNVRAAERETELQNQFVSDLRTREEEWERQAAVQVRAAEARLAQETEHKDELLQGQLRQRDQQWQLKLDAARSEVQTQAEQVLRRREAEAATALREAEVALRKEWQQKEEAVQARARQREQELEAQLQAQTEAHQAAQVQWQALAEDKARANIEHFKSLLDRTEKERDEAKEFAAESFRRVQALEKKLNEASAFLNGLKNGNHLTSVNR